MVQVGKLPLVIFLGTAKLYSLGSEQVASGNRDRTHNPELMPVDPLIIALVQGEVNVL